MILVVGGSNTYAFIVVNWPEGSTCQIVRSGDSKTLKAKDTSGYFVFRLPKPITAGVAETWTVSCTNGNNSVSKAVSITTEGQREEVFLSYPIYLIRAGALIVTPTLTRAIPVSSSAGIAKFEADGNVYALASFGPLNAFGKTKMIITIEDGSKSFYSSAKSPLIGFAESQPTQTKSGTITPLDEHEMLTNASGNINSGTYELNFEGLNGAYALIACGSSSGVGTGILNISNFYIA